MLKVVRTAEDHDPLAMFELEDDGTVTATYVSEGYKEDIESGLFHKGRVLRPKDGKDFLDALEASVSTSTRLYVETLD
jgi:hypothetical protein